MKYSIPMSLAYSMDPRQHKAMVAAHHELFSLLTTNNVTDLSDFGHHVYSGFPHEIAQLLEVVRQWKARPVTEERLNEILGDTDGT